MDRTDTWEVYWGNGKPFLVTDTADNIAKEYAGCVIIHVSEASLKRIERKEYESKLAAKKLKKAKR